jgi:DNA adenine methylase
MNYKKLTMKCGHCKQEGHTKRTCSILKQAMGPSIDDKSTYLKAPLKWLGGKASLLDDIAALLPKKINNYIEPFLGGGTVLLGVLCLKQQNKIQINGNLYASDMNSNIIGLYQNIQSRCDHLIAALQEIVATYSTITGDTVNHNAVSLEEALTSRESYYYWTRSIFNSLPQEEKISPRGSAMILFLNKTCFRGVYRESGNGFNVPFEKIIKNQTVFDEAHLRAISNLIQGVRFHCQSFENAMAMAQEGDVVYLDPPYVPEKVTSFVSYNADGFSGEQHILLFNMTHELVERHVKIIMSNADVPLVRQAFPEPYQTQVISVRRSIHSKKPGSKTNEVLITNA